MEVVLLLWVILRTYFIYSFYNLSPIDFFKITLPIVILAVLFLVLLVFKDKKMNLSLDLEDVKIDNKRDVYLFGGLFLIILLSVFHVIDYKVTFNNYCYGFNFK